ncbi:similar to Saccharomyces cerevisiae YCR019W MAK32 Protein necessary for structural stability of L-A double-stranded RNA-containing particles [Maudiozyma barnettii]|uniref:Similar to Saccharomyces cerevisiae YCR019W MAK32 Protein necessary for structural stability of L-A double-stranded RNA-containing particles n=1 Tax=Maudiozyma barnettii TaxID=61262 RepID=A0A8H2VFQ4_9SACH|nr:Mak32p [Kazachstania barnettii]CAB4254682.1 similar to Saccharomyces cerevisiae YCR019W MAK32 Protein necessary for structural stability of L-A double-stranded RNA-containing particles [Kazachstania barnettii]CAD1782724.1 similar to Saccharomyces cerevisiae YCR019W MAK32 Protein necessary for structural stability of L-A double-stranded RNA-containing particles [Kazachstania barnettii]
MLFTTNGMIILDDIHTSSGEHYSDVVGGAGTYAILGSCIVRDGLSGWIVDRGSDFPNKITKEIEHWNSGAIFRDSTNRLTTRGANFYGENDLRQFKYLTPKRQITVLDWINCYGVTNVNSIKCIHLVCSPERVQEILEALSQIRNDNLMVPTFIWEPLPDSMIVENYDTIKQILDRHENIIISPNCEEGARLFGMKEPRDIVQCRALLCKFTDYMKPENSCVLRCGKMGSMILSPKTDDGTRESSHFPAYHLLTPDKVVDPTGGGNSFLGGFGLAYALTKDFQISNLCGTISAGCNIEQIGVAQFDSISKKINNTLTFKERVEHYIKLYNLPLSVDDIYSKLYK